MSLPSSGEIKLSQINTELGRSGNATIALNSAEDGGYAPINQCSSQRPNPANSARMSEWYSYNHTASCSGLSTFYIQKTTNNDRMTFGCRDACGGNLVSPSCTIDIYYTYVGSNGVTYTGSNSIAPPNNISSAQFTPSGVTVSSFSITSLYANGCSVSLNACSTTFGSG